MEGMDKLHSLPAREKEESPCESAFLLQVAAEASLGGLEDLPGEEGGEEDTEGFLDTMAFGVPCEEMLVFVEACHGPASAREGHGTGGLVSLGDHITGKGM